MPEDSAFKSYIGVRLRERAQRLGLSDAEVARRIGITSQRYSHYVNGTRDPNPEILHKISAVLRTTVDELIGSSWPLLAIDREAHVAAKELTEYLPDLRPEEIRALARLALSFAAERRNEWDAPDGLPRRLYEASRVHERLMPAIIRTLRPRNITVEMDFEYTSDTVIPIRMLFPAETDPARLDKALRGLAKEQLRKTRFRVRSITCTKLGDDVHAELFLTDAAEPERERQPLWTPGAETDSHQPPPSGPVRRRPRLNGSATKR